VVFTVSSFIISIAFIGYGCACIFFGGMVDEFQRYGLSKFRIMVGALELLGGVGLLVGLKVPIVYIISVTGLIILMAMGYIVRFRLGDSFIQKLPALSLMIICTCLLVSFLRIPALIE
jgi:hypothetical protein